jgi:hypothetical protein
MFLRHVQTAADAGGDIDWSVNVDSTVARAHQHATGAEDPAAISATLLKRGPPTIGSAPDGDGEPARTCRRRR